MTDRPIIFSGQMVRALIDGRKTMTRRLAWRQCKDGAHEPYSDAAHVPSFWQKVQPGDRLWVRESLTCSGAMIQYLADHKTSKSLTWGPKWKQDPRPSIHMPRWASRLTLNVTATKIERLQDITEDDAKAEGIQQIDEKTWGIPGDRQPQSFNGGPVGGFSALWMSLHGLDAWRANPEVVALSFTVHKDNIDTVPE